MEASMAMAWPSPNGRRGRSRRIVAASLTVETPLVDDAQASPSSKQLEDIAEDVSIPDDVALSFDSLLRLVAGRDASTI